MMLADYQYQSLTGLRSVLSSMVFPLQYAIDYPIKLVKSGRDLLASKQALINENKQLHDEQTRLQIQLQQFRLIRNENAQLKELLLASPSMNMRSMAAKILAVDTSNERQVLVLNKGKREGVFVGQPVLDTKGVMGQIIDVGFMTSTVLLISDSKCAVPVRNDRTGERGILEGNNHTGRLSLINLSKTSSILRGDLLVTSGLGRRYPEGYPVGVVAEIKNTPGDAFIQVDVRPVALLNRSHLVLLIWPEQGNDAVVAQINERLRHLNDIK